jgi:hypothetical protein
MKTNILKREIEKVQIAILSILVISFFLLPLNSNSQTIKSFDEYESELTLAKSGGITSAEKLHKLYYEFNPGLVIKNTTVTETSVLAPVVIDVNLSEMSGLYEKNKKFESIEMIRINVEQSGRMIPLDISKLSGFKTLKYIVFQCGFDCNAGFVKNNLISGTGLENYTILYLVSIPE